LDASFTLDDTHGVPSGTPCFLLMDKKYFYCYSHLRMKAKTYCAQTKPLTQSRRRGRFKDVITGQISGTAAQWTQKGWLAADHLVKAFAET